MPRIHSERVLLCLFPFLCMCTPSALCVQRGVWHPTGLPRLHGFAPIALIVVSRRHGLAPIAIGAASRLHGLSPIASPF